MGLVMSNGNPIKEDIPPTGIYAVDENTGELKVLRSTTERQKCVPVFEIHEGQQLSLYKAAMEVRTLPLQSLLMITYTLLYFAIAFPKIQECKSSLKCNNPYSYQELIEHFLFCVFTTQHSEDSDQLTIFNERLTELFKGEIVEVYCVENTPVNYTVSVKYQNNGNTDRKVYNVQTWKAVHDFKMIDSQSISLASLFCDDFSGARFNNNHLEIRSFIESYILNLAKSAGTQFAFKVVDLETKFQSILKNRVEIPLTNFLLL